MGSGIGQSQRVYLVTAVENELRQSRTAQKHAEHDLAVLAAIGKCDQLPVDQMFVQIMFGQFDNPFQRLERIAFGSQIQRDQVGLAIGKHGNRGRIVPEMTALV